MSGKPADIPLPQPKKPSIPQVNASRGPSYSDAFAEFLQASTKPKTNESVEKTNINAVKKEISKPTSVIQHASKPARAPKNQQKNNTNNNSMNENELALEQQLLLHQQQMQMQQYQMQLQQQQQNMNSNNYIVDQNQRVKTERIPQNLQSQIYAVQENTVVAQNGEQQKLYYTILDSNAPTINDSWRLNGQQYYGQQQQQTF